jgi:hypothetical protein
MKRESTMRFERAKDREARENRMTRIVMVLGIVAVWAFLLTQNASG